MFSPVTNVAFLEIEHRVDDVGNFTHPSERMKLRQQPA